MQFLVLVLISLISFAASADSDNLYENVFKNGAEDIDNMIDDLIKNNGLDIFLQNGFKITDGKIEKCMATHFKEKRVKMYDIGFQTHNNLERKEVTCTQNWLDKVNEKFSFQLEANAPLSFITGKFDLEFGYKGSNRFTSIIYLENMNVYLRIQARKVPKQRREVKNVDYLCNTRVIVKESGVTFGPDKSVARTSSANFRKMTKQDSQQLISALKKCVTGHIQWRFAEEITKLCEVYIDRNIFHGSYEKLNKELMSQWRRKVKQ